MLKTKAPWRNERARAKPNQGIYGGLTPNKKTSKPNKEIKLAKQRLSYDLQVNIHYILSLVGEIPTSASSTVTHCFTQRKDLELLLRSIWKETMREIFVKSNKWILQQGGRAHPEAYFKYGGLVGALSAS